jgi:DNA-binding NtrC family response regulator
MKKGKLLIIDDNKGILNSLELLLRSEFSDIKTIGNPNLINAELEKTDYDVVLLDMNFRSGINSGNEGLYWLKEIRKRSPVTEVVMITAYGDVELAVKSLKEGAFDFIIKPWDNTKLKATLQAAMRLSSSNVQVGRLRSNEKMQKQDAGRISSLVPGDSQFMKDVMHLVGKVASTDANVLITGENGTGKELIAREIHNQSNRSDELFVSVDLSALTESLFESELFGHKKGSFTNAMEDKMGRFTLSDKGTLFLDEIGNIPLNLQSKILTVLQTRLVTPVGSTKEIAVDFRLICATNKNLQQMVRDGHFRQDLLYRMNTIQIHLPPLRERPEDIEALADHFLKLYSRKYNKPVLELREDALAKLKRNAWPGNIRELQHTIEKAVILADSSNLKAADFVFFENESELVTPAETLDEMEKKMIIRTLKRNNNNQTLTADQLGVTRQTLYNKLKKYGI